MAKALPLIGYQLDGVADRSVVRRFIWSDQGQWHRGRDIPSKKAGSGDKMRDERVNW
ncbi:MAG: hypothetical protein R2865_02905 [Deinococcales bacterium]